MPCFTPSCHRCVDGPAALSFLVCACLTQKDIINLRAGTNVLVRVGITFAPPTVSDTEFVPSETVHTELLVLLCCLRVGPIRHTKPADPAASRGS